MKVVGGGPVLDDLAVLDAADHDPPDPDRPAAVVALGHPARGNALALADLVLDADAQMLKTSWRARSVRSLADIAQDGLGLRDPFPANGLAVRDRPHVREACLDLHAAR